MTWTELNNTRKALSRMYIQENPKSEYHRILEHTLQKRQRFLERITI